MFVNGWVACLDVFSRCVVANGRVDMYEVVSVGMLWFQDVFLFLFEFDFRDLLWSL